MPAAELRCLVSIRHVLIDAAVWVACGLVVGVTFARRDWRQLSTPGFFTTLRRFESDHFYERRLFVRRWKELLPEAGTWFGGISKRRLPRRADGALQRFAAESLRAERVHWTLLGVLPVVILWSRGWLMVANMVFGLIINVPCIVVARYNRMRLARINIRRI